MTSQTDTHTVIKDENISVITNVNPVSSDIINGETNNEQSEAKVVDVYSYTKTETYTCELFKVKITNLPKNVRTYSFLKKFIQNTVGVVTQKIKLIDRNQLAYIALRSEEDRKVTIDKLNGFNWKGNTLEVVEAQPKEDPFQSKRVHDSESNETIKRVKLEDSVDNTANPIELLNDKVCPLWRLPYDEQLDKKSANTREFLQDLRKGIGKTVNKDAKDVFEWYLTSKRINEGMICPLIAIVRSPEVVGYRNKCEFSIGEDKTVGFRAGAYKDGSVNVINVDECSLVNDVMKKACRAFETYLKEHTKLVPFSVVTRTGHWSQLTVRTSRNGQCMVIPMLNAQTLSSDEIETEKSLLTSYFKNLSNLTISSLYLQFTIEKKQGEENPEKYEKLHGEDIIVETLEVNDLALNFKISPNAFFQINPSAAESLYKSVCDLANVDESTVLLDVCCGTGTIGMCLASKVKQVVGIELVESAVENAKRSADENNIKNIKFIKGTAENVFPTLTSSLPKEHKGLNIVAIIDPPRAGLSKFQNYLLFV